MNNKRKTADIIRMRRHDAFEHAPLRIVLDRSHHYVVPLRQFLKYCVASLFILSFLFGSVYAPVNSGALLAAASKSEERAQLEAQLAQIEQQIADYEKTVNDYRKQGASLESEIKRLNATIAKLNLQIKAITLNLKNLDDQISDTSNQITKTQGSIADHKDTLASLLQTIYQNENKGVVEMIMENPKLSDFFLNLNNVIALQDNVRVTLQNIVVLQEQLISQKKTLTMEHEDVYNLKQYQESQKKAIASTETEKKSLLDATKGQEEKYAQLLKEKKQTAAQIRSRIFELIGGGELSFGEAYRLAKTASNATNVPAALILAVLDRESALGKNVGQCEYNKNPYYPSRANNPTTMNPTRDIPVFMALLSELQASGVPVPNPPLVSCPIPVDGAYGGAMGPAQFIPSTWDMYKNRIAKVSGHNPPSPWNNADAFVATALYLSDAYNSSSCTKYANDYPQYDSAMLKTRCAAAKYYAGGNWWKYRFLYGDPVVNRANQFQQDIDILNGK